MKNPYFNIRKYREKINMIFGKFFKNSDYKEEFIFSDAKEPKNEDGYTLIEVVVTILIMGMILLMINMVLISLIRVSYDTDARMNLRQDVEFAIEVIRRDVKTASPAQIMVSGIGNNEINLVMSGSGEVVIFKIVEINGVGILRSEWPSRPRSINLTSPTEVNVKEFSASYFWYEESGTGELIITIVADSVNIKSNGEPVVKDFYKKITIVTRGQEL